jgi:hypothetical protein
MNVQISTIVNGNTEYIELYGNESFTLDISFAEIQDITKKNSAYSRDINVPGSDNNNYIFNYFFDINQVPLDFTPSKKFEASILYNGYIIASGYIRLNSVVVNKLEKTYNITFYNGIGDVGASIGDKFMRQLDLSSIDHPFSDDVIYQSTLDYNLFPLTGTTNYSYQNGKTYWPLLNIGYNYTDSASAITGYYSSNISGTSITIDGGNKTINIGSGKPWLAGDTIRFTNGNNWIQGKVVSYNRGSGSMEFDPDNAIGTGTFTSWGLSYVLPEGTQITDARTSPLLLFAPNPSVPNYMSFSGTPIRAYYPKPSIQVKELYTQIFNQAGYEIESEFFNTSYFERYYLPLKFLDETIYTKGAVIPCYTFSGACVGYPCLATTNIGGIEFANQVSAATCNNVPFSATSTGFTISSAFTGQYTFRITATYTLEPDGFNAAIFGAGVYLNGVPFGVGSASEPASPAGVFAYTSSWEQTFDLTGSTVVNVAFDFGPSVNSFLTSYKFEIAIAPGVIIGNFDYAKEFPENDFKQIDFITSINKYFNLVCIPSNLNPKSIIIEPIIDFIGKGRILDWSNKIDYDSPITVSPTTSIINGTLNYNFKLDQDYINQQFNIANNRVFGTYQLQLNQEYKDNNINFDTIFGSPTDVDINNTNLPGLTAPSMAAIKTDDKNGATIQSFNPYKILPRLIFRGVTMPNQNYMVAGTGSTQTYWIEDQQFDRWSLNNRFTTYPFSYTGFSHYINFNSVNDYSTKQEVFPDQQDMYDIYYYDYISDITAPENKIMSGKIYLTPYEIANLEFNERILIKNTYFRINKIAGFNLTEPGLCNIELIKLTKEYTPHPVKYFDLISCTGGTDYHTTSDLNYNLYAYIGNYVNLYTGSTTAYTSIGCYQVVEGVADYNFDYNQVFIGSGYTSSGVNVYTNCGCSGSTAFNIVQQT